MTHEQWRVVASMDDIQAAHPDWNEEQCRAEFNRLADENLKAMLASKRTTAQEGK